MSGREQQGGSRQAATNKSPNIFGCQLDIAWENKGENYQRVRSLLGQCKMPRGSLVVLPEMFATGFSMNAAEIAERGDGPTVGFLRELAREKGVYILGGLVRRDSKARLFNEAVCIGPTGRLVARYAKLQLFSPGGESRHYFPGADITVFRWGNMKVSVNICYDLRFPEVFRLAAQRGAEILVVIANWPTRRHAHWSALLRSRAIENQAYVIGVNRCGKDPQLEYSGDSMVLDPHGETVAAGGRKEGIISTQVDRDALKQWRRDFAVLKDMRTSFNLGKSNGKLRQGR